MVQSISSPVASAQLQSHGAGLPVTCLAVHPPFVHVGTAAGGIVAYDERMLEGGIISEYTVLDEWSTDGITGIGTCTHGNDMQKWLYAIVGCRGCKLWKLTSGGCPQDHEDADSIFTVGFTGRMKSSVERVVHDDKGTAMVVAGGQAPFASHLPSGICKQLPSPVLSFGSIPLHMTSESLITHETLTSTLGKVRLWDTSGSNWAPAQPGNDIDRQPTENVLSGSWIVSPGTVNAVCVRPGCDSASDATPRSFAALSSSSGVTLIDSQSGVVGTCGKRSPKVISENAAKQTWSNWMGGGGSGVLEHLRLAKHGGCNSLCVDGSRNLLFHAGRSGVCNAWEYSNSSTLTCVGSVRLSMEEGLYGNTLWQLAHGGAHAPSGEPSAEGSGNWQLWAGGGDRLIKIDMRTVACTVKQS